MACGPVRSNPQGEKMLMLAALIVVLAILLAFLWKCGVFDQG